MQPFDAMHGAGFLCAMERENARHLKSRSIKQTIAREIVMECGHSWVRCIVDHVLSVDSKQWSRHRFATPYQRHGDIVACQCVCMHASVSVGSHVHVTSGDVREVIFDVEPAS